jgi:long-subunit acyl-CoA synthetase (AMP-forming)
VSPTSIENALCQSSYIKRCFVYGDATMSRVRAALVAIDNGNACI